MIELPDVNVLVALLFERHVHHGPAVEWFVARADAFATCAVTQTGFVRIASNPRLGGTPLTLQQASATLSALCGRTDHRFLEDRSPFVDNPLVPHERLVGHRQVTDAHLVAIARANDAVLTTFDRGCAALSPGTTRLLATS